jgi:DNA-binding response OmpR family regulator
VIVILERAQDQWLAKWSGADRWLVRPVDPFELAEAVRAPAPIGGKA